MVIQRKVDNQRMLAEARFIRENISRARGYLRRDEFARSIEAACDALMRKGSNSALGLGRSEVDLLFIELCDDFSRHPKVIAFLESLGIKGGPFVRYKPGDEMLLAKKLAALRMKMEEVDQAAEENAARKRVQQREEWLRLGQENLAEKNYPKGKVYLRRVVETYGDEPEVIRNVGRLFLEAGLLTEAAEMFALAIERAPNDQHAWRLAIETYDALSEFQKAETLYLDAVKVFGGHPMTVLNIAKFYLKWHKKDDAYEYAQRALAMDADLEEAKAIRDQIEK